MLSSAVVHPIKDDEWYELLYRLIDAYAQRGHIKYAEAYDDCDHEYLRNALADIEAEPPSESAFARPRAKLAQGLKARLTAQPVKPEPRKPGKDQRSSSPWQIDQSAGKGYWLKMPLDAALDHRLSDGDCRLLLILMHHCRDKDHCWPPEEMLAGELVGPGSMTEQGDGKTKSERTDKAKKVSVSTIKRQIANLKAAGYLTVIRPDELTNLGYQHHTKSNTYRLNLPIR
jgi:hypothetical protein